MTVLQGPLADRAAWSAVGHCPIEKTMGLVGTKSAMLIMREAYYGTTAFRRLRPPRGHHQGRDLRPAVRARRGGVARQAALSESPVSAVRDEYVLTTRGHRVHARRLGDVRVGEKATSTTPGCGSPTSGCGAEATVEIRCADGSRSAHSTSSGCAWSDEERRDVRMSQRSGPQLVDRAVVVGNPPERRPDCTLDDESGDTGYAPHAGVSRVWWDQRLWVSRWRWSIAPVTRSTDW